MLFVCFWAQAQFTMFCLDYLLTLKPTENGMLYNNCKSCARLGQNNNQF